MKQITQNFSLNDCSDFTKKIAKEISKKYNVDLSAGEFIRKGLVPSDTKFEENETASVDYISTKAVDRDGDIVLPQGAILDHYKLHPIVLYCHKYRLEEGELPLGRSMWIKSDEKGLISKTQYYTDDPNCMGTKVWNYRKAGFPMAKSIGFIPLSYVDINDVDSKMLKQFNLKEDELSGADRIFDKWVMTEYSDVPIPSNPMALEIAIAKGFGTENDLRKSLGNWFVEIDLSKKDEYIEIELESKEKDKECQGDCGDDCKCKTNVVTKPETTENYHHIPVESADKFDKDTFRTINISEDQGIKAVIGKYKSANGSDDPTHVQKYMFDKDEWSMDEAKKWVEEHKKDFNSEFIKNFNIAFSNPKSFFNEDGEIKYTHIEDIPHDIWDAVEDIKYDTDGETIVGFSFKDKTEALKYISKYLDSEEEKEEFDFSEIVDKTLSEYREGLEEQKEEKTSNEEIERIIKLHKSFKNTEEIKEEDKKGIVSKQFGEDFDISSVRVEPYGFEYKIFTKYLGCKMKNMFMTDFFIPHPMKGNYCSAFENVLAEHKKLEERNFTMSGHEVPIQYSVIQLNSKKSKEFLINGTRFYKGKDGQKFVIQFYPTWGGIETLFYSEKENSEFTKSLISDSIQWVEENNLLKGEKFSISGEFLEKTGIGWDDVVFPSEKDKNTIKRTSEKLAKNVNSRGIMFIGNPGTGKTRTGRILMEQSDATFIWASSKDFKYGASHSLGVGFEMARKLAPSVLFMEDIDSWLNGYAVDLLKTEMDGIRDNKGVLTVLTSNFPEEMPEALIDRPGRFHNIINFCLPNKENRIKMLNMWLKDVDEDTIDDFAEKTEGFSGSHMRELVDFAKMISEDEDISMGEGLIKSLEQMKEQKELINSIKNPQSKSFSGFEIEINKDEQESEDDFLEIDLEQLGKSIQKTVSECVSDNELDISEIVGDGFKKARGVIF